METGGLKLTLEPMRFWWRFGGEEERGHSKEEKV